MKGIMRPHVSLFLFLIIFPSFINSQTIKAQKSSIVNDSISSTLVNSWSFQLMYAQSPISTRARDMVISVKKGISQNSALRASVTVIGFFVNEFNSSSFSNYSYGWLGEKSNYKSDGQDYTLAYIFYPFQHKKIQLYGGAGFVYSYYNESFNQKVLVTDLQNRDIIESYRKGADSKTKEGGPLGIIGIEWFLFSHVSLIGEYDISFVYGKSDVTNFNRNDLGATTAPVHKSADFIEFRSRGLRVGLSIYL